jgi:hypothetical protein
LHSANRAGVELYIDRRDRQQNLTVFKSLLRNQQDIENAFSQPLEWDLRDNVRAARVRYLISKSGYRDESEWPNIIRELIEAMIRFEKAISPYVKLAVADLELSTDG